MLPWIQLHVEDIYTKWLQDFTLTGTSDGLCSTDWRELSLTTVTSPSASQEAVLTSRSVIQQILMEQLNVFFFLIFLPWNPSCHQFSWNVSQLNLSWHSRCLFFKRTSFSWTHFIYFIRKPLKKTSKATSPIGGQYPLFIAQLKERVLLWINCM